MADIFPVVILLTVVLQITVAAPVLFYTFPYNTAPVYIPLDISSRGVPGIPPGVQPGPASLEAIVAAEAAAFEAATAVEPQVAHLELCVEATAEVLDAIIGSSGSHTVRCIRPASVTHVEYNPYLGEYIE